VAARRTVTAAIAAIVGACLQPQVYPCESDAACVIDDRQGMCKGGFCAYPDAECASTLRFGPSAGGMSGECVPENGTDTDPTIAASSESSGCGACDDPPDRCHLPAGTCEGDACVYPPAPIGTDCKGDDPCVIEAQCDGAGECVVMDQTVCNDPPNTNCWVSPGTCNGPDDCDYAPKDAGSPCEDGDDCTLFDMCDGNGVCIPDDVDCYTTNKCATGSCGATGQCSFFPVSDGDPCGALPTQVCCNGACVNLEDDEDNCGGCGVACMPPQMCSAMDPTPMCVG
jgi:hypothetical protein